MPPVEEITGIGPRAEVMQPVRKNESIRARAKKRIALRSGLHKSSYFCEKCKKGDYA